MKKIYLKEERVNQAGTDWPHYYDPKTDTHYEGSWDGMYAFPFGYWPIDYNGTEMFCVGDACTMHSNACGKAAERYFMDCLSEQMEEGIQNLETNLENFVYELKEYGYTYNEETDFYESSDGSHEFDINEKIMDFADESWDIPLAYIGDCIENAIKTLTYPSSEEISEHVVREYESEYNFYDKDGIDDAMKYIGMSFDSYFEMGRCEGRIWPKDDLITFYETEQPDPGTLMEVIRDLSQCSEIGLSYEEMLQFIMIFEDGDNDWQVTACTVSDYINGNYGIESEDGEEDMEKQYARDGKTQFVPHLANQQQKREFFKGFRDTRDQAVYVPREKVAGSLAKYHAMRYPYGEGLDMDGMLINENRAGTDMPYYEDGNFEISGDYNDDDARPFGYFPIDPKTMKLKFFMGSEYGDEDDFIHVKLLGKAFEECLTKVIDDNFEPCNGEFTYELTEFFRNIKENGYKLKVNLISDDIIFADEGGSQLSFVEEIKSLFNDFGIKLPLGRSLCKFILDMYQYYNYEVYDFCEALYDTMYEYYGYDFGEMRDMATVGDMFGINPHDLLYASRLEGRIWTETRLITFYPGQQPSRNEMQMVIEDISNKIGIPTNELYEYYTIFETNSGYGYDAVGYQPHFDATVQCCTIAEYIQGKYNGFNREQEIEMVKNRKGIENLNVHLANQDQKREFFKGFRDTRDKAVYSPRERAAGSLARYHAMRYPYGESKKLVNKIIKEEISKIL